MDNILPMLIESLEEEYSKPREGNHVSDIVLCPRKTCYQKIDPIPLDMKSLNFFSSGRAIHESLQVLANRYPDRFEIEKEVVSNTNADAITGHIDLYDKIEGVPIEAKSMRVKDITEPKPHHVDQLKAYMALTGSNHGILLYQLLLHFEDKPWREYHITMSLEERVKKLNEMQLDVFKLQLAVTKRDPQLARHIAYVPGLNWMCRTCPYEVECLKLRLAERLAKDG